MRAFLPDDLENKRRGTSEHSASSCAFPLTRFWWFVSYFSARTLCFIWTLMFLENFPVVNSMSYWQTNVIHNDRVFRLCKWTILMWISADTNIFALLLNSHCYIGPNVMDRASASNIIWGVRSSILGPIRWNVGLVEHIERRWPQMRQVKG